MARRDLTALDAEIRKRLIAGQRSWSDLRHAYPDVAESTFSYRVNVVRKRLQKERREHRAGLADPFGSASVRRDPYKLFVDVDVWAELDGCWALQKRIRAMSVSSVGIVNPYWFDQQMKIGSKLVYASRGVLRDLEKVDRNFGRWAAHLTALARLAGSRASKRLPYHYRRAVGQEPFYALVCLVEVLGDAKLIDTGPAASRSSLRRAIKQRLIVIKMIARWGSIYLDGNALFDAIEWFANDAAGSEGISTNNAFGERLRKFSKEARRFEADQRELTEMARREAVWSRENPRQYP